MSYKRSILLLSILLTVQSYTDLTLLNCPSQFNITKSNITTENIVASLGSFVYAAFQSDSSKKRVISIVTTGNTSDLSLYIKEMMVPYIIFASIFFFLFILIIISCLFDKSCPPSECLRRDLLEKPYTKREIRVVMFFTLVFAVGVLVISLISFSYIPAMKTNLALTQCSIYLALDSALNGDGTWGGFISLRNQIGNITNLLPSAVTQIGTYFPGDDWLINDMTIMKSKNLQIYSDNKLAQMITPNPDTTATAANAGQSTPMIDSLFIKAGMGPNATFNTMVDDIDRGLRTTEKLSLQASKIDSSSKLISASTSTIQATSSASQSTLYMYINQLDNLVAEYTTFSNLYFNNYFSTGLSLFQGVLGFVLAASLLVLLGIVSTHIFEILTCRRMVHLGWVIFGLAYVGIIVITFIFLSLGSIGYGFCNYFQEMLTVQTSYDLLGEAYTQNAFKRLDVCMFGDGNALEKFSIAKQMKTVTDLFTNIATFEDYMNSKSTNFVDVTISSGKVSGWVSAISKYRLGIYVDSLSAQTTNDNPNYAINQLNLYTNYGGGVATGSKDRWVWDSTNCTDPNEITYSSSSLTYGTTLTSSNVTCISFNQKIASNYPSSWTMSDFTMRYVQIRQNYTDAYNQIIKYGATLINFRDSRLNLFQGIQDMLNDIYSRNINFNNLITSFKNRVTQFYAAVSTLNNLITNPLNGLLASSNCQSLAAEIRFTYNVFCVNFMAQIVKLALCSTILLVIMLAGIFAGCRFGMIYAEMQKMERINMPVEELASEKDMQLQGEDKHQNSSTSSNSADDEKA